MQVIYLMVKFYYPISLAVVLTRHRAMGQSGFISQGKSKNTNISHPNFAVARVVGLGSPVKHTNNGWLNLLPKIHTNKG